MLMDLNPFKGGANLTIVTTFCLIIKVYLKSDKLLIFDDVWDLDLLEDSSQISIKTQNFWMFYFDIF